MKGSTGRYDHIAKGVELKREVIGHKVPLDKVGVCGCVESDQFEFILTTEWNIRSIVNYLFDF